MQTKTTINFIDCKSEIPIVSLRLKDGGEFLAIVDSGSEQTMFDKEFAEEHNLSYNAEEAGYSIIGVATEYAVNCSPVIANLDLGENKSIGVVGITADLQSLAEHFAKNYGDEFKFKAIIGSDTLYKINAKIDYTKKQFSFTNEHA